MRFSSDTEPGHRRAGHARPRYLDCEGRPLSAEELARVRKLAIPPAWTDVWICADPDAHLQATGRDARGRKQYRYHDAFRAEQEATKFESLPAFGEGLGRLRRRVERDLSVRGLPRERVVATVVRLLDLTLLRVGNEEYARANGSFGLTTLRSEHVVASGRRVRLQFVGKSAHRFDLSVEDPRLVRAVRSCQDLPGQLLFQWEAEDGSLHHIGSSDVNDYLREHGSPDATAKTFRTWGASVLAAEILAPVPPPSTRRDGVRAVNAAVDEVAATLGNTRAVCRRSYVHPAVVDAYLGGELQPAWSPAAPRGPSGLSASERRFLRFLRQGPDAGGRSRTPRPSG